MIASNSVDGLAARDGFKAPEQQISPLALDRQLLCLRVRFVQEGYLLDSGSRNM